MAVVRYQAGRIELVAVGDGGSIPLLLTGRGITLGSISAGSRTDFEATNRAIDMHRLRPVIDRTFPFAEAKAAYRHFEGRSRYDPSAAFSTSATKFE